MLETKKQLSIPDEYGYLLPQLVGEMIKRRTERNVSQSQLSRETGVPQKTISRVEGGLSSPQYATMEKLLEALDCKVKILFEDI